MRRTNRVKYIVKLNGIVVKSGHDFVDNKNLQDFEMKLIANTPRKPKDVIEVEFR